MTHTLPANLLTKRVSVHLIGCGGTGSMILQGLGRLHLSLLAYHHPGLHITAYDPDTVSPSNIGRQLFSRAETSQHKAITLIQKINLFYETDWTAQPTLYPLSFQDFKTPDIIISCADNVRTRKQIHKMFSKSQSPPYWLDCGNRLEDGQVILGNFRDLPNVVQLYPLMDDTDENIPSCSLAEALTKQSLMINPIVANYAIHLLSTLFKGTITTHGTFINLTSGRTSPLPIDPKIWKRINPKYKPQPKGA